MQFKYSYSSLSKKKKKIHIVKPVVTSFIYLFYIKLVVNGIQRKKINKLTWCFIWLLASHHEITHSVRSRESMDRVLVLWKIIIVLKAWSLKTFLFRALQICQKVVGENKYPSRIQINWNWWIKVYKGIWHILS